MILQRTQRNSLMATSRKLTPVTGFQDGKQMLILANTVLKNRKEGRILWVARLCLDWLWPKLSISSRILTRLEPTSSFSKRHSMLWSVFSWLKRTLSSVNSFTYVYLRLTKCATFIEISSMKRSWCSQFSTWLSDLWSYSIVFRFLARDPRIWESRAQRHL